MNHRTLNHRTLSSLMLCSLLLLAALGWSQPCFADAAHPKDEAAIRRVLTAYEDAWNQHDAHAFSLIFAPDAEFTNVRGIAYPGGRIGIEQAHRPLFATMFQTSHVTTERLLIRFVRPDVATVDVYWRMTGSTDRDGKPRGLVQGLRSMVLSRDDQEHPASQQNTLGWQIVVFHNMEIIGPTAGHTVP